MSTRMLIDVFVAAAFLAAVFATMDAQAQTTRLSSKSEKSHLAHWHGGKPARLSPTKLGAGKTKLKSRHIGAGVLTEGVKNDGGGFAIKKGKIKPIPPMGPAEPATHAMTR